MGLKEKLKDERTDNDRFLKKIFEGPNVHMIFYLKIQLKDLKEELRWIFKTYF